MQFGSRFRHDFDKLKLPAQPGGYAGCAENGGKPL